MAQIVDGVMLHPGDRVKLTPRAASRSLVMTMFRRLGMDPNGTFTVKKVEPKERLYDYQRTMDVVQYQWVWIGECPDFFVNTDLEVVECVAPA